MELKQLYSKLTGTDNPKYATRQQKLVIGDCLKIINDVERLHNNKLIEIRNNFVTTLPTGEVTAWDMICWAKDFTNYMDKIIAKTT